MQKTKLYGLVEGLMGTHYSDKTPQQIMQGLPESVQKKCMIRDNTIMSYSACDG